MLRGEWLRPGALVCAVGANRLEARELDNAVVERATFVCCDSKEQASVEAGDLVEPVERGVLDWLEVHELAEVVGGEVAGRQSQDDIVLFKSLGIAAEDLAVAKLVLRPRDRARRRHHVVGRRCLGDPLAGHGGGVLADRADHLGPLEQAPALLLGGAVLQVRVVEDVLERAAELVLANDVRGERLLLRAAARSGGGLPFALP